MALCYNRGCGQQFDLNSNYDDSCRHHPGEPYFHDAYKIWTCCKKKSVNFTEFLNIKGCQLSKHSNVKPPEPVKEKIPVDESPVETVTIETKSAPTNKIERPKFDTKLKQIEPVIAAAVKESVDEIVINKKEAEAINKNSNGIKDGTICKNAGCGHSYSSGASDEPCNYHSGAPIFHEGYKFWSCCNKRTTEFSEFLNQKGCTQGQHKWSTGEQETANKINVRYDWHQTAANVVIAIYAKLYHYELSFVKLNPIRLMVHLCFPESSNSYYDLDMELCGIINVDRSAVHMNKTKIEISLSKAYAGHWVKLNIPRDMTVKMNEDIENNKNDEDSDSDFNLDDVEPSLWTKLSEHKGEWNKDWRRPGGL